MEVNTITSATQDSSQVATVDTSSVAAAYSAVEVLKIDGQEISKKENVSIAEGITLDVSGTPQRFERSKDMRTQEEKDNLLRGAKEFHESHPYVPPAEVRKRLKLEAEAAEATNADSAAIMKSTQFTKKGSKTGALLQYVDGNTVAEEKNNSMALGITPDASGTPRRFERSKDMCTKEEQKILLRWVHDRTLRGI